MTKTAEVTTLPLLSDNFEKLEDIVVDVGLGAEKINKTLVHQIIKTLLMQKRQCSSSVKTRSYVSGGGAKPFKQKGTGRARQGSSRSPLQVGGATVFGPVPKKIHRKINKKMMLGAVRSVLADKHQAGKLMVLNNFKDYGKTREASKDFGSRSLKSCLLVAENKEHSIFKTVNNVKNLRALPVCGFSVYQALKYEYLVLDYSSLKELVKRVKSI